MFFFGMATWKSIRKKKLLLADTAMCSLQWAVVFDDVEIKNKQVLSLLIHGNYIQEVKE